MVVAPYVGAWIETWCSNKNVSLHNKSHPTWVRGLKQVMCTNPLTIKKSHPTWVRGLKHRITQILLITEYVAPYVGAWIETSVLSLYVANYSKSHPTWVRGLKHFGVGGFTTYNLSHPTWVRGLKHASWLGLEVCKKVAPYVGAWIETCKY